MLRKIVQLLRSEGVAGLAARLRFRKRDQRPEAVTPAFALPLQIERQSQAKLPELAGRIRQALDRLPVPVGHEAGGILHLSPTHGGADFGGEDAVLFDTSEAVSGFVQGRSLSRRIQDCAAILVPSADDFAALTSAGIPSGRVFILSALQDSPPRSADDLAGGLARWLIAAEALQPDRIDPQLFAPLRDLGAGDRLCLSLPETPQRRNGFLRLGLSDFQTFDGIRRQPGWQGCGWSYATMARAALDSNAVPLTICEDDLDPGPNFRRRLGVVESYLNEVDWDVFSGLLTNVPHDCKVSHVEQRGDLTFVHLDFTIGMVFNIYGPRALARLSDWTADDRRPQTNTVDQWLGSLPGLRVVTTLPFLAGHSADASSTIFGFSNRRYVSMIRASETRLKNIAEQLLEQ